MKSRILSILFLLLVCNLSASAQVKIRIFADQLPESAIFSVTSGEYEVITFSDNNWIVKPGTLVAITKFRGRLAVKVMNDNAVACDSVCFKGRTGKDIFSLRSNGKSRLRQTYSGDLCCFPDLSTMLFINICDLESYIAGVALSEGGSGKNIEYYKTQAVIARTYAFRYFDKHAADHFNLCDNTHCQAFNGITDDTIIIQSALETSGEVILGPDSLPIISAFHSNCGGETSPSEDVWLTSQPYLRKVKDPYCLASHNAKWNKSAVLEEWISYLRRSGFTGSSDNPSLLSFSQITRSTNYRTGSFSLPLRQIRQDFDLRSTYFSIAVEGDSVFFRGRGYGHGVGLCQEGAMEMAAKGFTYRQIIGFYYTGVRIAEIRKIVR
jgi:stage II sporulation protein D